MRMFVAIYEHEITGAYLHLNERKCVEHTINLDYLERMEYKRDYPNGYGDYLPCLKLFIKEGQKIVLYREDADKAYSLIRSKIGKITSKED